jgi:hypothetical protein
MASVSRISIHGGGREIEENREMVRRIIVGAFLFMSGETKEAPWRSRPEAIAGVV